MKLRKKICIVKEIEDCEDCPSFRWNDYSEKESGCCSRLGRDLEIVDLDEGRTQYEFPIPPDCPLEAVLS